MAASAAATTLIWLSLVALLVPVDQHVTLRRLSVAATVFVLVLAILA